MGFGLSSRTTPISLEVSVLVGGRGGGRPFSSY